MTMTTRERELLYRSYIEVLRDIRSSTSTTPTELAEKVGVSVKYVTMIEKGLRNPSVEVLVSLLAAAGAMRETASRMCEEMIDQFEWSC